MASPRTVDIPVKVSLATMDRRSHREMDRHQLRAENDKLRDSLLSVTWDTIGIGLAEYEYAVGRVGTGIKRVYLAGPMTGVALHNFPAFKAAAAKLRAIGIEVFNPAENVPAGHDAIKEEAKRRAHYMRQDITAITGWPGGPDPVDAVVVLPDWWKSRGARLEIENALQLNVPILYADTLRPVSTAEMVRAHEYKHPDYLLGGHDGVAA